ncbi:MAG TPA: hypothetical protein VN833_22675 [Candidatus Acidoferrales bacterium]|nr:hypothetical protein [Candidatus Acidoferrales bacterium]
MPTSNHDHLLIGLLPGLTLAEVVQKLKANASRRLGENGVRFKAPDKDMELLAQVLFSPPNGRSLYS